MKNLNKAVIALSGAFLLSIGTTCAYMMENETSSIDELQKQGYSDNALRLVDDQNERNSGKNVKYVRHYKNTKSKNVFGRAYTRLKVYFDPCQNDDKFGKHQINYSNSWMNDQEYRTKHPREIENL